MLGIIRMSRSQQVFLRLKLDFRTKWTAAHILTRLPSFSLSLNSVDSIWKTLSTCPYKSKNFLYLLSSSEHPKRTDKPTWCSLPDLASGTHWRPLFLISLKYFLFSVWYLFEITKKKGFETNFYMLMSKNTSLLTFLCKSEKKYQNYEMRHAFVPSQKYPKDMAATLKPIWTKRDCNH